MHAGDVEVENTEDHFRGDMNYHRLRKITTETLQIITRHRTLLSQHSGDFSERALIYDVTDGRISSKFRVRQFHRHQSPDE